MIDVELSILRETEMDEAVSDDVPNYEDKANKERLTPSRQDD